MGEDENKGQDRHDYEKWVLKEENPTVRTARYRTVFMKAK